MLRQAINDIYIEGILAENELKTITYSKDGKEVEAISGRIIVKVTQPINGVEKELMIPINYFQNKYKKDGNINSAWKSLETVMNTFVSIAASNEDEADRVQISHAEIDMNEYYPTPDKLSSFPRIKASFVNRISKERCHSKAEGDIEFCLVEKIDEVINDIPTGRIKIKGVVPGYNGRVNVVPFIASSAGAVDYISNHCTEGDTCKARVKLDFSSATIEIKEELEFGEPVIKQRTVNVSDIILSGIYPAVDPEMAFDAADVHQGLAERKARLEVQKAKDMAKTQKASTPSPSKSFGLDF